MHGVNYLITTALPVAMRRAEEMELLRYYRDQLIAAGGKSAPSFEDLHLEYRRALVWGVYIGWLTTPVVNYGWEICVANHIRLMTAFHDHETADLSLSLYEAQVSSSGLIISLDGDMRPPESAAFPR